MTYTDIAGQVLRIRNCDRHSTVRIPCKVHSLQIHTDANCGAFPWIFLSLQFPPPFLANSIPSAPDNRRYAAVQISDWEDATSSGRAKWWLVAYSLFCGVSDRYSLCHDYGIGLYNSRSSCQHLHRHGQLSQLSQSITRSPDLAQKEPILLTYSQFHIAFEFWCLFVLSQ